ncbi:MAG: 4-hydroxy-tetrahydrodipicolinate synthase [Archaeoglobaceae archaeon]|nr:4-hydroxy-tetrahydrodipicolinate synthase [Archaeoglobaceae archaeon]MDW7989109.1 4-hydroxy-tetrahydrodipicolinate synthase [Archaeoglobaceae archaeon]
MFKGVIPALVTPFKDFNIDYEGLTRNIEYMEKYVDAFVPCGTTGEASTLGYEEHIDVVRFVVETSKLPVIAGSGSNSTKEAIWLTKEVEKAGADAAMLVTPYYNKPNDVGLFEHYKAIAKEVSIPMIVYNIPSRTGINVSPHLMLKLSEIENIVGIKEASGDLKQISDIIRLVKKKNFTILSGDDFLTLPILAIGGKGVISVAANVVPHLMKELYNSFINGNIEKAIEMHHKLSPLFSALSIDTNPIPVKKVMELIGLAGGKPRLPLVELSVEKTEKIKAVLKDLELI